MKISVDWIPNGANGCGTDITVDQRGVARPQGGGCDIGAYETAVAQDSEPPLISVVAADPNPTLLSDPVALTAVVDDTSTGNSDIASADYQVDGGSWLAMGAVDSAFDSPLEEVEATLTFEDIGTHTVCVRGTDALGNIAASNCITVDVAANNPPVLEPIGNQTVDEGMLLSLFLTATDPDGDKMSFTAGNLPTEATFLDNGDGTALFEWTPTFGQAGNYPVLFTVFDDGTPVESDFEEIVITVGNVNHPPVLDPIIPQGVAEGEPLSFPVTASDPDNDVLTLRASDLNLPTGATFTDNGDGSATFEWTPAFDQAGNYDVIFIATDNGSPAESDTLTVTVTVGNVNRPPQFELIGNKEVDENVRLSFPVIANDPDGDALTLSAAGLPTGAMFVANGDGRGLFEWTPQVGEAGSYRVTFTVSDTGFPAESDSEQITIDVTADTGQTAMWCSKLGDNAKRFRPDLDVFQFEGMQDEQVLITLSQDPGGIYDGERARLTVRDRIARVWLFRTDRGALPNQITVTLPATGVYHVSVLEQLPWVSPGKPFTGDYCLTLESSGNAYETLQPLNLVE